MSTGLQFYCCVLLTTFFIMTIHSTEYTGEGEPGLDARLRALHRQPQHYRHHNGSRIFSGVPTNYELPDSSSNLESPMDSEVLVGGVSGEVNKRNCWDVTDICCQYNVC